MWDLIVSVPDHYLSFYLELCQNCIKNDICSDLVLELVNINMHAKCYTNMPKVQETLSASFESVFVPQQSLEFIS